MHSAPQPLTQAQQCPHPEAPLPSLQPGPQSFRLKLSPSPSLSLFLTFCNFFQVSFPVWFCIFLPRPYQPMTHFLSLSLSSLFSLSLSVSHSPLFPLGSLIPGLPAPGIPTGLQGPGRVAASGRCTLETRAQCWRKLETSVEEAAPRACGA